MYKVVFIVPLVWSISNVTSRKWTSPSQKSASHFMVGTLLFKMVTNSSNSFLGVQPYDENIGNKPFQEQRLFGLIIYIFLLITTHKCVGIGGGYFAAHCITSHLQEVPVIKVEVVTC